MSLDARYLLVYYNLDYVERAPMQHDVAYLKARYGGTFYFVSCTNIYWDKPKYMLDRDELKHLHADQVLERKDCELWEIIKWKGLINASHRKKNKKRTT